MSWWKRDWSFCLILAVVTMLAYQPAWHGGLLWDDNANIATPDLRSLDGLRRIWFVPRTTQQYYPLLYTSSWLQERFWGDSTTGYHLVNLLLHIGCAVLALKILRFLRIPGAELAAIIFALHPVNVESVAWISERKNTLSGLFGLAATLWYLKFDEGRSRTSYALALGLFLFGLLSKTAIVTLPLAWLIIFWWKRGAISWRRDVVPVIPCFVLSVGAGLMTWWVEYGNIGYKARSLDFSFVDRCLIAGRAFWFQLGKVLWPVVPVSFSRGCPGIAGNFVEAAAMVPGAIGGSAHLHCSVVSYARASQSIFFHLLVRIRSLAIFGLPRDHRALRQWDRPTGATIEALGNLAGAWNHPAAGWSTVFAHVAAKPDVYRHRNALPDSYCP